MSRNIIRQQIHLIPELVKAALLSQALDVEKVIASTFEPTDEFKAATRNLPMNHLEKVNEVYSDLNYRAFEAGVRHAKTKCGTAPFAASDSKVVAPIPDTFLNDLLVRYADQTSDFTKSLPAAAEMECALKCDLAESFDLGVKEGVLACEQEKYAKDHHAALPPEETKAVDLSVTASTDTKALDEYCKLLGTPESERILRYYLGLGEKPTAPTPEAESPVPQTVQASAYPVELPEEAPENKEEEIKLPENPIPADENSVGPFFIKPLRELIIELCKEFYASKNEKEDWWVYEAYTDGDLEYVVVDCLVKDIDSLTDSMLLKAINIALDCQCEDIEKAMEYGDELAEKLSKELDLDGDAVIMTLDGNYCMLFSFKPSALKKIVPKEEKEDKKAEAAASDKSLAKSPMGALSVKVQAELRQVAKLTSNFLFKDLKKASSALADYYGSTLTDIRNSKVALKDGTRKLNAGLSSAVEAVYGLDGLDFFNSLKGG